jgi:protein-S-isoprenylcysteine O-methyltransferase Ste14
MEGAISPNQAVGMLWMLWVISWIIVARWSAPTIKTTRPGERSLELLLSIFGIAGIVSGGHLSMGGESSLPLYSPGPELSWTVVAFVALGFGFCWWARVLLGSMWSANITLKEGHRIIDTGPYALVRHPIYSGILLAGWATAALHASPMSFIGAASLTAGFYLKARREEKLLIAELGPAYEGYLRRVPMLVPFTSRLIRQNDK